MQNLNRLLQRLASTDLDFVVVGGYAAMLHGSSQVTRDLHICMVLDAANLAANPHAFEPRPPEA